MVFFDSVTPGGARPRAYRKRVAGVLDEARPESPAELAKVLLYSRSNFGATCKGLEALSHEGSERPEFFKKFWIPEGSRDSMRFGGFAQCSHTFLIVAGHT